MVNPIAKQTQTSIHLMEKHTTNAWDPGVNNKDLLDIKKSLITHLRTFDPSKIVDCQYYSILPVCILKHAGTLIEDGEKLGSYQIIVSGRHKL